MNNRRVAFSAAFFLVFFVPAFVNPQAERTPEGRGSIRVSATGEPEGAPMPPGAAEIARLMSVGPLIEQFHRPPQGERGDAGASLQSLALRQEILEAALTTSLEVDGVVAEIESELAQVAEVRSYLESRRDRKVAINTVANIVTSGGMGVVGQLVQIKRNTLGNAMGAVAGGISAALSAIALRQQAGGRQSLGIAPNMLAKILDRTPEFHSDYPELVWSYLNAVPPTESGTETRRARLIKGWIALGRMDAGAAPKAQRRIELLTSSISRQTSLTIDLLADRAVMLEDVRAQILLIKRDLSRLMQHVRGLRAGSPRA